MVTLKFGYFGSKFDSDSEVGGTSISALKLDGDIKVWVFWL